MRLLPRNQSNAREDAHGRAFNGVALDKSQDAQLVLLPMPAPRTRQGTRTVSFTTPSRRVHYATLPPCSE